MCKNFTLKLTALAITLGLAQPAHAICDGCVVGAIEQAAITLGQAITTAATTAATTINTEITAAIKGSAAVQAQAIADASSSTNDAIGHAVATQRRAAAADRYRQTDPCGIYGSTVLSTASAAYSGAGRGGARTAPVDGNISPLMQRTLDVAEGRAPAPDAALQAATSAQAGCETFGNGGLRARLCNTAGLSPRSSNPNEDGDIRAATLVDGPQGTGKPLSKRRTITTDGDDSTAVRALLRNIVSPLQLRDLTQVEASSTEGRKYMALKDSYDARLSMAEHPLTRHIGLITADPSSLPGLQAMLQGVQGAWIAQYLDQRVPGWRRTGVSADELANLEVRRRTDDVGYQQRMVAASPEEVQREQLQVAILLAKQGQQTREDLREIQLSLGHIAAIQTRTEMTSQMVAQHKAAAR